MGREALSTAEKTMLQQLSQKKQKLEEKLDELAREIEYVKVDLLRTQADYGAIYNKQSPLLNVPPEVTCLVFEYALLPSVGEETEGEDNSQRFLMEVIVSHVCRRWRAIALGFPNLWSAFCYQKSEPPRVPLDRLDAYMERSGSHLLELRLDFRGTGWDDDHGPLLDKAGLHVARWRRVTILSDQDTPICTLLSQLTNAMAPNLEYLAICQDTERGDPADFGDLVPKLFQGGAPKLRSLWMDGTSPTTCLAPLTNITTLRLEEYDESGTHKFSWTSFLALLSLPALRNLSLVGETFQLPNFALVEPIHMNCLKNLRFSDDGGMANLLPLIRAPLLETLHIRNCWIGPSFGTDTITTRERHIYPFPSLRDLYLVESSVNHEPARRFISITSSARNVILSHEDMEECLLTTFNTPGFRPGTKMWPHLKTLTCNIQGPTEIEPYLAFVKSRPRKSGLVLRLDEDLVDSWREDDQEAKRLMSMKKICTVDILDRDDPLAGDSWPPGEEICSAIPVADEDPFTIESYYPQEDLG